MKYISVFIILVFIIFSNSGVAQENLYLTLEPVIPDFQVNENMGGAYHGYPSVAISDEGSFLIVWEDDRLNWDLFGRVYSADGIPKGPEFGVIIEIGRIMGKMFLHSGFRFKGIY